MVVTRKKDRLICGYIRKDSELKMQGCSDSNRVKVGMIFLYNYSKCMYCGSIVSSGQKKYLIYDQATYVANGYSVEAVEKDWFRDNIKNIEIIPITKEQLTANKKYAKTLRRMKIDSNRN